MAYTVFDDDAESILPQKAAKASLKKQMSLAKHVNGHTDPAPVASTSSAILPPAKPDASNGDAEDGGQASAVFKKRKASISGISQSQSKSRKRSPDGDASPHITGNSLSRDEQSILHSKTRARETTPLVTSRRVATFYDQDEDASDDEEVSSPGKARGLDVRAGESKKQARKRQQADRKDKAEHLLSARQKLPVYAVRDAILKEIEERDTVVVLGETGSGKTTQIPQFLLSSEICRPHPRIAVTQPRRVAATSLARRVSEEYGCTLGSTVGYTVRFDDCSSPKTRLKYLTDGTLLQEILGDRLLESYDVVIIDEAHERTLRTDMILGFIKEIQIKRKEMERTGEKGKNGESIGPLKIVVMSATIDAERFSDFFDGAKILFVQGRTFNVKTMYLQEATSDYIDAALKCIFQIHYTCPPGDVLVFLAGQEEIENLKAQIETYLPTLDAKKMQLLVCPLYARLTPSEQNKAFSMAPPNTRKVILATNVAETSITISGIKYVIDTGMQKEKTFHPTTGMDSLLLTPISKNSATQRSGRAGREAAGTCFRLYTEKAYQDMRKALLPEIQRCSLAFALLHLLAYGQEDVTKFNFMDRPSTDSIASALMELYGLGATDQNGRITETGRKMAALPLEPKQAKVLLASFENQCSSEIIDLLALLGSADAILSVPFQHREAASAIRSKFIHRSGDHMMLLNILKAYEEICESMPSPKERRQWCKDHFLSIKTLNQALDARVQLRDRVNRLDAGLDCTMSAGDNEEPVLLCLLAGLFTNTAMRMPDDKYRRTIGSMRLKIHPSSILHGRKVDAIVFSELTYTSNLYARIVSSIPLMWLRTKITPFFHHDVSQGQMEPVQKEAMNVD